MHSPRALTVSIVLTKSGAASKAVTRGDDMSSATGTIKRKISDKGFGFIAAGDGKEYFFHQSACTQTPFDALREGDSVTFEVGQGPKGPRAENVRPA